MALMAGDPSVVNHIHLTGYVVNTDLPAIYSQCTVFLYPSLRESFGIPILEAMACGTPVLTANTSSMPEISGGAAYLVDPFDTAQITNGMCELTDNQDMRSDLINKGYHQASLFTWEAMAHQVFDIYQEIVRHQT